MSRKERWWIRKYMMNNLMTRDFWNRHPRKERGEAGDCPVCLMQTGEEMRQTKEHLFGGECGCTRKIWKEGQEKVEELLGKKVGNRDKEENNEQDHL